MISLKSIFFLLRHTFSSLSNAGPQIFFGILFLKTNRFFSNCVVVVTVGLIMARYSLILVIIENS